MTEELREVTAGLGYVLIIFGLTLIIGALLYIVLNGPMDTLLTHAENQSQTNASATGISYVRDAQEIIPLFTVLLGMVQLIAGAVYESRRGV